MNKFSRPCRMPQNTNRIQIQTNFQTLNSIAKTIKNKHAANYFGIYFTLNFSKSSEMKRRAKRD